MKRSVSLAIVLTLVIIVAGFYLILNNSSNESVTGKVANSGSDNAIVSNSQSGDTKIINIKAARWQFTPGTITVKKGERVKIMIDNTDTTHGIVIPDLGVSGIDSVEFTADKPGTYEFKCPTMCGEGHKGMKGTLIVE